MQRKGKMAVDVLTFVSMHALMYSGIVLSRHVFSFLPIKSGLALARRLHILGFYWGFLLMSLHLGLHWNLVLAMLKGKRAGFPRNLSIICRILGLAAAVYGACVFVKRDFFTYLFLQSEFAFFYPII